MDHLRHPTQGPRDPFWPRLGDNSAMATVTVKGSATAGARPDRAQLHLSVTEVDREAAAALTRTAERSRVIEGLLRELGIAPEQWTTSGVSVAEEYEWRTDRNEFVGYRATASVRVTVRDLEQLGTVIGESVTRARAQVAGPFWQVDADNPVALGLLRAAAVDARRRAEAYADALGLRLGEVETISELPPRPDGPGEPGPRMEMMKMAAVPAADAPVNPGEIDLAAEVFVRFALLTAR